MKMMLEKEHSRTLLQFTLQEEDIHRKHFSRQRDSSNRLQCNQTALTAELPINSVVRSLRAVIGQSCAF